MADGEHPSSHALDVPPGLSWCSDEHAGLSRRRSGRGFSYRDARGRTITDAATLARIRRLAIPPAWTEVWICPRANGHIQATGRDARGRKQYRYHPDWSAARAETKFDRMAEFARALPRLHRRVETDLGRRGLSRDKVLATTVRLLELTLIRVGNREYARANRSYGLTTLHRRHIEIDGSALRFQFRGKSGKDQSVTVRDRRLARVIRAIQDLPGQHLFKYLDADGDRVPLTSDDVNGYIREAMGDGFSAKDFRTWAATLSAARWLREAGPAEGRPTRRQIRDCCEDVARRLGNTPAVCRSAYIHPAVFDLHEDGSLHALPGPATKAFETALIRSLS